MPVLENPRIFAAREDSRVCDQRSAGSAAEARSKGSETGCGDRGAAPGRPLPQDWLRAKNRAVRSGPSRRTNNLRGSFWRAVSAQPLNLRNFRLAERHPRCPTGEFVTNRKLTAES